MNITYVPYSSIAPRFGVCYSDGRIEIRDDLPENALNFVLAHEQFHATDKATNWLWRELRANLAGLRANWRGFLIVLRMSLNPVRLKYYWLRFREGK